MRFDEASMLCASTAGGLTSFGGTRKSSHGDISAATSKFSTPLNNSCDTICYIQVVPDLARNRSCLGSNHSPSPALRRKSALDPLHPGRLLFHGSTGTGGLSYGLPLGGALLGSLISCRDIRFAMRTCYALIHQASILCLHATDVT